MSSRRSAALTALMLPWHAVPVMAQSTSNATLQDMATVREQRISAVVGGVSGVKNIPSWMASLGVNGKWPDSEVNYTTGCAAQRANWPASAHWSRITTMVAAYHGGAPGGGQWVNDAGLRQNISSAMDYWFSNDFVPYDCLYNGGVSGSACPCGTPGLWNTNWFSNVILVPIFVAESCMILNDTLTITQANNCSHMTTRAYSPFYGSPQQGFVSGANILDMSKIGIDQGVRSLNSTLVTEAYGRVHAQMVVVPGIMVDGIKPDGSFGQHTGLLYNGNYGTVFSNDVLALEEAAAGTQFAASDAARSVFATLFDGDKWMVFYNTLTGVLHWDFSCLPRFITFPVSDNQPDANIMTNLTQVGHVGEEWGSSTMVEFAASLSVNATTANAGSLNGHRHFFSNDYTVHRGSNYVSTLKMYSSRTKNTEYTNTQNPFGFHLADGTLYTYVTGDEYEDIAAAWDWNKIPGITTDYGATQLTGNNAGWTGIEKFVGGVSTGTVGLTVMRYTNPMTKAFSFNKAWFFLDGDVQRVMAANISSATNASVFSILDQKRHSGPVMIAGLANDTLHPVTANSTNPISALWHANVGYTIDTPLPVFFAAGARTGAWSAIGTSTAPPETVDLFSAWLVHRNLSTPAAYTAFPGLTADAFDAKRRAVTTSVHTVRNDAHAMAVWDDRHSTGMAVFWDAAGGSVQFPDGTTLVASAHAVVIFQPSAGNLTVADPSQSLQSISISVVGAQTNATYTFVLPTGPGGLAGSSVTRSL